MSRRIDRRSDVGPTCLFWNGDGLWACAEAQRTGFPLGRSTDGGRTFEPLLLFSDLCGHSSCGVETDVGALCPNDWLALAPTLEAECDGEADAGIDAVRPSARGGCSVVQGGWPGERAWCSVAAFVGVMIVFRRAGWARRSTS